LKAMTVGQLIAAIAISAALSAASVSCARSSARVGTSRDTLYIGVAAARTSSAYFHGAQLAIDRLNAERPADTPALGLRMPPTVQPTQVGVAAHFRDDPSVIGVVGHTGSAQMMEAAPIYGDVANGGRHAVVAVTPTATNPDVTRIGNWVFRICPTDDDAAHALAKFATDSLHAERIAIVYRNDLFGRGFTRTIAPALTHARVSITERDPYLAEITEYQAYAARMAKTGVDAVIFAGSGIDAAEMVRALASAAIHPAILGSDDVGNILDGVKSLAPNVKQARAGRRHQPTVAQPADDRGLFKGVRYASFYDVTHPTDGEGKQFLTDYTRRFGQPPTPQAALSYDAAMLIGRAALAVGTDRHRIRDWIAAVGANGAPMHGITGDIRFDSHGDAIGKSVIIAQVTP
jgi:branched-chain amino acid transport system substrate-binding protein